MINHLVKRLRMKGEFDLDYDGAMPCKIIQTVHKSIKTVDNQKKVWGREWIIKCNMRRHYFKTFRHSWRSLWWSPTIINSIINYFNCLSLKPHSCWMVSLNWELNCSAPNQSDSTMTRLEWPWSVRYEQFWAELDRKDTEKISIVTILITGWADI